MRPKTIVAGILIALGIAAFAYQGIAYTTRGETGDAAPLHVTIEKTQRVPLPSTVGAISLFGGIALLLIDQTRARSVTDRRALPHR